MYIRSVIDVPHVPTMICTKAFLGILDRVRFVIMLREVESWAVGGREMEREIEKRVRKRRRWRERERERERERGCE